MWSTPADGTHQDDGACGTYPADEAYGTRPADGAYWTCPTDGAYWTYPDDGARPSDGALPRKAPDLQEPMQSTITRLQPTNV